MGWLDNSTNNIILDAVLTDYGRKQLALSNGAFRVAYYSFGDDEVNYSLVKKYGRTIGREKIEKNTPVFEAFTNQNIALKYRLFSTPDALLYLPTLSTTTSETLTNMVASQQGTGTNYRKVVVNLKVPGNISSVPATLSGGQLFVDVPDLFLVVPNATSSLPDTDINKIKTYIVGTSGGNSNTWNFAIQVKSISESTWGVYGQRVSGQTAILTQIRIAHSVTGAVTEMPVTIYQNNPT